MNHKQYILAISGVIMLLAIAGWLISPKTSPSSTGGQVASASNSPSLPASPLIASETQFDFGEVSMAKGKVSHDYNISNPTDRPITLSKLSTSCMCTTATLVMGNKRSGPFGMTGHGYVPKINQEVAPGTEAIIQVVFDPAAHGPAGVGKVQRLVYLEPEGTESLELGFTATVTP